MEQLFRELGDDGHGEELGYEEVVRGRTKEVGRDIRCATALFDRLFHNDDYKFGEDPNLATCTGKACMQKETG